MGRFYIALKKNARNIVIYYICNIRQFPLYCRNKYDVSGFDFHSSGNLMVIDKFRNYGKLTCLLLTTYSTKCKANYAQSYIIYCRFVM